VIHSHLLLIFCSVFCLVSCLALLPTLRYLEFPEHLFFRVHRLHRSVVCSWESGSLVVARDSRCYRSCRVDKRTATTKRPADLKLLTLTIEGISSRLQGPICRAIGEVGTSSSEICGLAFGSQMINGKLRTMSRPPGSVKRVQFIQVRCWDARDL
jgi:hypothetical protein